VKVKYNNIGIFGYSYKFYFSVKLLWSYLPTNNDNNNNFSLFYQLFL